MLTFFFLMLAISALLLSVATAMERSAIKSGTNGANGLVFLVAFILSGLVCLAGSLLAAMIWGRGVALASLVLSGLWHLAAWKIVMASFTTLIARKLVPRNGA